MREKKPQGAVLRLHLLGAPRLEAAGAAPHALERRTAALLAVLALNGPTPRARAAALVWPEVDDQRASNSLRQRIFKLRQVAGCDVIASDRLISLAAGLEHDLADPLARLAADGRSCQGELLGELDFSDCRELDEWVAVARQRWRDELARSLAELASRLENEGRIAGALELAERLVQIEPTQEHAHRRVMRLHYLRGDGAAALNAFDRCRMILRAELGVAPDAETQALQQLIESGEARPLRSAAPAPVAVLRPPRLVGREAEWQRLERAHAERRTVLVVGEAGIGKSRLLADFAAAHAGLVVRARPGDATLPYSSLARLLRAVMGRGEPGEQGRPPIEAAHRGELARILPELGAAPSGPLTAVRLRSAAEQVVAAAAALPAPLRLIAFDDAQFADAASLELLSALDPRQLTEPKAMRWLLASRSGELPGSLLGWTRAEDDDAFSTVALPPLDAAGVRALLESLALPGIDAERWAPGLLRHTGGNPMFILETLRALLGRRAGAPLTPEPPQAGMLPLPADVGQLIERRLQQLSPAALDLARVAALAGPDFSPELAGKVLERRVVDLVQPWQELEAAQVIRDQAFAHDLVLEATQRSVPQAVARALHRAIGQLLAAAPGTQAAERCAEHLWLAGDWAAAAAQFEAAAAQAKAASLPAREAALWQRAIEAHERAGQAAQAHQAGMQSVDALLLTGSATRALEFTDRLVQQARSSAQRLRALLLRAYARLLTNQTGPALVDSENALAQARAARDEECEFDAARMLGMSLALSRRAPEGATLLESYAAYAMRHPSERQRYKYWSDYAYVLQYTSRRHECLDALLKAVALAEGLGEQAELMTTLTNAANVCSTLGRYDQTISLSLRAVRLNERLGTAGGTAGGATLLNLAAASAATGRYERALALFEQADAAFASAENDAYRFAGENHLASMYLHLGQPARALQTLRTAPEAAQGSSRLRRLLLRARIARFLGQPDQDWMRQAQAAAAQSHEMSMGLLLDLDAAMALPAAAAAARIEEVAEQAQAHEYEAIALRARLLRIEAGLRDGAAPVPPAELDAVAAQLESRQPMDTYLPEAHWIVARAWAGRGEARQATASLELAHRWIIETALPHVPQPMRESFLQRNPVNRAVLARIEAGPLTSQ